MPALKVLTEKIFFVPANNTLEACNEVNF